jgi:hypothetical protein
MLELVSDTHVKTEDASPMRCITIGNTKTIETSVPIQLYNARLKLVPLIPDSKRVNVDSNLVTGDEFRQYPSAGGKPVRIIHEHSSFWSEERLKEESYLFYNVNEIEKLIRKSRETMN